MINQFYAATDPIFITISTTTNNQPVPPPPAPIITTPSDKPSAPANPNSNISSSRQDNATTQNVKVHILILGDTNDPEIGISVRKDMDNVEKLFKVIFHNNKLNITPEIKKYSGSNFNRKNIFSAINSLEVTNNDVVIVYSSNHGLNSGKSNFPTITFDGTIQDTLSLNTILSFVKSKNPRLSIVMGDMCNIMPLTINANNDASRGGFINSQTINNLFIKSRGTILSSSAMPFEYSWSNNTQGGYFTKNFYEVLKDFVSNSNSSNVSNPWNQILDDTYRKTTNDTKTKQNPDKSFGQHGVHEIKVSY